MGQGQFVLVVGESEAIIIDSYVPLAPVVPIVNVKGALAKVLQGKKLVGLLITGFDSDHFNEIGIQIVLNKYRPEWIAYPQYFKKTQCATNCFGHIDRFDARKKIRRVSFQLRKNSARFFNNLCSEFSLEMFSPHAEDMDSSNNCSLVCKIREINTDATYLVTGDTELIRWHSIVKIFGSALDCDVLAAAHHGSKNGVSRSLLECAQPHTVLISAGVDNQYGHPDATALALYKDFAQEVWCTKWGNGQSLRTNVTRETIKSFKFTS
ncbi:MAG TPA: hypothetical protein VFT22_44225 [Kofleriaceae bacterium]|nr:hypothetical protein [Kofleriaceae bacterium]